MQQNIPDSGVKGEEPESRGVGCLCAGVGFLLSSQVAAFPTSTVPPSCCFSPWCLLSPLLATATPGPRGSAGHLTASCSTKAVLQGSPPPPAQELGFPSEQRSRLLLVVPDESQERVAMLTFYRMGLPKHLCVPHVELIATFPVTPLRGCLARAQETAGMGITSWGSPDVPHLETALDSLIVPGLM